MKRTDLHRKVHEGTAMMPSSYSDVFSLRFEREGDEEIRVGDRVRTGANAYPHFEVIAVQGDKAWVRNLQTGADDVAGLSRLHKIHGEAIAWAAE
jgi:hypothetical protein